MTRPTGKADLPLHGGRVPAWLAGRMTLLGRVIAEAIVLHFGREELLRRLAHPFWFQSFGAVMGMDWHSSGITTSVIGALKRGLAPVQDELGIFVCGGRGRHARQTPAELQRIGERTGLDADALTHSSRLVAKIDSAAVQDGYDLYLHGFFASASGSWCVVQQGMNPAIREARRYHWLSENVGSFLDSPHAAIDGRNRGAIINLADEKARRNREASLSLVHSGPDRAIGLLKQVFGGNAAVDLFPQRDLFSQPDLPGHTDPAPGAQTPWLRMPHRHHITASDVVLRRLHATLAVAADRGLQDFPALLMLPGVGRRTIEALAMVAEVVHGAPARFADPARFAMAHGGKDGHPFPVPLKVYDQTIRVLTDAVSRARMGNNDRLSALQRLDQQARVVERTARGPALADYLSREREQSPLFGGRSV